MKRSLLFAASLFIVQLLCSQSIFASEYKLVKRQGNISLYERWIKKDNGESVRELKAEFFSKGHAGEVINLLKNQQTGKDWNSNVATYKVAPTANANKWINYIKYDMPAFMGDQECCLLFESPLLLPENNAPCRINFSSADCTIFPATSSVKRITGIKGCWLLQPQQGDRLKITYTISSDRNTKIPRFISDPIVHSNLFKSMQSFKNLLEH